MRTNISKFKNLKRSDFKNLLDFTDKDFKSLYHELIEVKVNRNTNTVSLKEKLQKLKILEKFYLFNLCVTLKEYENIDVLNSLFFSDEYENFQNLISVESKLKFEQLKKDIIRESRQKNPLFKKEIVFKMFISDNIKNLDSLYSKLQNIQLSNVELKKEYKFLYQLITYLNKSLNAKIPRFELNIEKFRSKNIQVLELEILTKFWEKEIIPKLNNSKNDEYNLKLILAQYIFRDYLFNQRDTLVINVISENNYLKIFKELDEINKDWKHAICLYLYKLCEMDYIRTKSKDDVIYFLSIIFKSFSGFSFSSIELRILNYRFDYKNEWENFIKNSIKTI